jgi:hypothetical protein
MTLCVLTTNQPATAPLLLSPSLSVSCRRPTSYHAEPHYFISAVVVSFGKSTLTTAAQRHQYSTQRTLMHGVAGDGRERRKMDVKQHTVMINNLTATSESP